MRRVIEIFVLLVFAIAIVGAEPADHAKRDDLPRGWRIPTGANLGSPSEQKWREADPSRYLAVSDDFNGDGLPDVALLLIRDDGAAYALFVGLAQKDGRHPFVKLDEFPDAKELASRGIKRVAPGEYPTACARGLDCAEDEPRYIHLKHDAIDYFTHDAANRYYYWNELNHSFSQVGIND
jgi:hypothetical protein